eukprot:TRINITY_DN2666_c0_g2_i1.p1 TRINITY_DN2666_c0_g2~~TRINITY_DN2666_c0_g2_i1.p1  ORF type:complete len:1300 (-),score=320.10 TRINITY_DN2666_c0_g2_i1:109-3909(-)
MRFVFKIFLFFVHFLAVNTQCSVKDTDFPANVYSRIETAYYNVAPVCSTITITTSGNGGSIQLDAKNKTKTLIIIGQSSNSLPVPIGNVYIAGFKQLKLYNLAVSSTNFTISNHGGVDIEKCNLFNISGSHSFGPIDTDLNFTDITITKSQGPLILVTMDFKVERCNYIGNSGPFNMDSVYGVSTFRNSEFSNNTGNTYSGAAITSQGNKNHYFYNCTFNYNNATQGDGGAVAIFNGQTWIYDSRFSGNYANQKGGALIARNSLYVYSSTFNGNYGRLGGGAIWADAANGNLEVNSSIFEKNSFNQGGGTAYSSNLASKFYNCTFKSNHQSQLTFFGGAIWHTGKSLNISQSYFEDNWAVNGGAVYSVPGANITGSTFKFNHAYQSGAYEGPVIMDGCLLYGNEAISNSGALGCQGCVVTRTKFIGNSAQSYGGAMTVLSTSFFNKCEFKYNTADMYSVMDARSSVTFNEYVGGFNYAKNGVDLFILGNPYVLVMRNFQLNCDRIQVTESATLDSDRVFKTGTSNSRYTYGDPFLVITSNLTSTGTEGGFTSFNFTSLPDAELMGPPNVSLNGTMPCDSVNVDSNTNTLSFRVPPGTGKAWEVQVGSNTGKLCFYGYPNTFNYLPPLVSVLSYDFYTDYLYFNGTNLGRNSDKVVVSIGSLQCLEVVLIQNSSAFRCKVELAGLQNYQLNVTVDGQAANLFGFSTPKDYGTIISGIVNGTSGSSPISEIYSAISDYFQNNTEPLKINSAVISLVAVNATNNDGVTVLLQLDNVNTTTQFPVPILDQIQLERSENNKSEPAILVLSTYSSSKEIIESKQPNGYNYFSLVYGLDLLDVVGGVVPVQNTSSNVSIIMSLSQGFDPSNLDSIQCLWWNEANERWETEGCYKGVVTETTLECLCNHLTNFTLGTKKVISPKTPQEGSFPIVLVAVACGGALLLIIVAIVIVVVYAKHRKSANHIRLSERRGEEADIELKSIERLGPNAMVMDKEIGRGAYSTVFKAITGGTNIVAVKQLNDNAYKEDFLKEAKILNALHHPNVVQFLKIYESFDGHYCMMLELMSAGSLLSVLKDSDLAKIAKVKIAQDVVAAMKYLEENAIIHTDLSARNVLMKEGPQAKLGDFGKAKQAKLRKAKIPASDKPPVRWSPPEVLNGEFYSHEGDVWSFGVLLYEMCMDGKIPYSDKSNEEVIQHVKGGGKLGIVPPEYSEFYEITQQCLSRSEARPSFSQIFESLSGIIPSDPDNITISHNVSSPRFTVGKSSLYKGEYES